MLRKDFKVIIVGGGVGGLTLANILEQLGIGFVLLESRAEMAPQVGASIGLSPNGLRILDQLGCHDAFLAESEGKFLEDVKLRLGGRQFAGFGAISKHLLKRHGYNVVFNDRQKLLAVLFHKLQQKNKVLVNKRVVRVSSTEDGASVTTADNETYAGHLVVGVDGIYSTVRQEMWRIAGEVSPGYFPQDEMGRVPIDWRCMFGISKPEKPFKSLPQGVLDKTWGQGFSHFILGGPGGRLYWFVFEKLEGGTVYGDKTPRYGKADEADIAARHRDDRITEDLCFGDLYDCAITKGVTPLHEYVFERWHFGRIITLGDSAHKMNPLEGQGGNCAIESVTSLANHLSRTLDSLPSVPTGKKNTTPSAAAIHAALQATQAEREERVRVMVKQGHDAQALELMDTPLARPLLVELFLRYVLTRDMRLERGAETNVPAVRVDGLAVPRRPHFVPYDDELPAAPLDGVEGSLGGRLPQLAVGVVLLALLWVAGRALRFDSIPDTFRGGPIKGVYTGLEGVDAVLAVIVGAFGAPVAGGDPEHLVQLVYFLVHLAPVVLIWTVEGHRRGNKQSIPGMLLTWPSIWAFFYQTQTIAKTGPVYFLLSLLTTRSPIYSRVVGRIVDPAIARAVLPALILGYCIPTALMFLPLHDAPSAWQNLIALWQFAPLLVSPLTTIFAAVLRTARKDADEEELDIFRQDDVPHLLDAYRVVFTLAAMVHVCVVAFVCVSPTLSLGRVFGLEGLPSPFAAAWPAVDADECMSVGFRYDMVMYVAPLLVWCLHSVFEMRRLGYVRTSEAWTAAFAVLAGVVVVGPGAVYAGTWYWRESVIAELSKPIMRGMEKQDARA